MALPLSRNETATPASPVSSTLANDLQDQIIGAKHGWVPSALGAPSWVLQAGGTASLGQGQWTFGAVSVLQCALPFPVGTVIRSARFLYNRGGAGTITITQKSRNILTGAAVVSHTLATIAAGTGLTATTITDFLPAGGVNPLAINADTAHWLEVQCDNVAHVWLGAYIERSLQ